MLRHYSVPIKIRLNGNTIGQATGFLYDYLEEIFLITNWHVATRRHNETLEIQSISNSLKNQSLDPPNILQCSIPVWSHGHGRKEIAHYRIPFDINLYDENGYANYYVHPLHKNLADIVAIKIHIDKNHPTSIVTRNGFRNTINISLPKKVGNTNGNCLTPCTVNNVLNITHQEKLATQCGLDIYILGYPEGLHDIHGNPIWKKGTIASDPETLSELPFFMIDSATRPGMSGAPVYQYYPNGPALFEDGIVLSMEKYYKFIGIYSGRIGDNPDLSQIGRVYPASLIKDILKSKTKGEPSYSINVINDKEIEKIFTDVRKIYERNYSKAKYDLEIRDLIASEISRKSNYRITFKAAKLLIKEDLIEYRKQ